jgi:crotonobetaine/carnitine-CoA ligase
LSILGYDCAAFTYSNILADKARKVADKIFLTYLHDGRRFSYADMDRLSNSLANGLLARGIGKGAHVSMLMQNSPEQVLTYFALGKIGAVVVPINTAARGAMLEYYLLNSDSVALFVDQEFLDNVQSLERRGTVTDTIVLAGEGPATAAPATTALAPSVPATPAPATAGLRDSRMRFHDFADLLSADSQLPAVEVGFSDVAALMYTSGTTGPSKGNIFSQIHSLNFATPLLEALDYNSEDVFHVALPLFHAASFNHALLVMLLVEGSVALSKRLSMSHFWEEVRSSGATRTMLMSVGEFLLRQPPTAADRSHRLRTAIAVPMLADAQKFEDRFGVRLAQAYGLTDCCLPLSQSLSDPPGKRMSIGRPMPGCQVRLVDDCDRDVPVGDVGEIVIRKDDMPFAVAGGYYKMPEATLAVTRNLWFHTGDRGRMDEDGYFYFVDRKKDAIRRRGENISTFEVETLVGRHPAIAEVAAYPVRSDTSEDDVAVSIITKSDLAVSERELFEFCRQHMPHFMIPRYIDIRRELPRTATHKVRKQELRAHVESNKDSVWDCECHGLTLRRERIAPSTMRPERS